MGGEMQLSLTSPSLEADRRVANLRLYDSCITIKEIRFNSGWVDKDTYERDIVIEVKISEGAYLRRAKRTFTLTIPKHQYKQRPLDEIVKYYVERD